MLMCWLTRFYWTIRTFTHKGWTYIGAKQNVPLETGLKLFIFEFEQDSFNNCTFKKVI